MSGASLDWVTYDSGTNEIIATSSLSMFAKYANSNFYVSIVATSTESGMSNNSKTFSITVYDYVSIECGLSVIPQPDDIADVIVV